MTINENFNQSSFTGSNGPENGSAPQPTLRRILYRHPSEKMVAGVCGGIADYTGWDPSLVRTLWVIVTFVSGGAGLAVLFTASPRAPSAVVLILPCSDC